MLLTSEWADWSADQLDRLGDEELAINQLIYAEVSYSFASQDDLDRYVGDVGLLRLDLPWKAAFAAGQAYLDYRRRGGPRTSPMPVFYIGAHALVAEMAVLTRDTRRFRTYFPNVRLIAPY